jgi:hypothetical protein
LYCNRSTLFQSFVIGYSQFLKTEIRKGKTQSPGKSISDYVVIPDIFLKGLRKSLNTQAKTIIMFYKIGRIRKFIPGKYKNNHDNNPIIFAKISCF